MATKNRIAIVLGISFLIATGCGNNENKSAQESGSDNAAGSASTGSDPKGIGKFKNVELTHPLDQQMVAQGKAVYEMKCMSCHKLTNERLVGPGWKGVTDRRTPEWIMNFVTNVEEMIDKDTAGRRMLEECLVRMPNQNLSDQDARTTLEYMRHNDGKN